MKIKITFLLLFLTLECLTAQIIDIPDANFKNALVNTNCVSIDGDFAGDIDVDTNDDGEIDISEAQAVNVLSLHSNNIDSLDGIEYFTNLTYLDCAYNNIVQFDISQNINLEILLCQYNQLTTLDLSNNSQLNNLECYFNALDTIDLTFNEQLKFLFCYNNPITDISFPINNSLEQIFCSYTPAPSLNLENLVSLKRLDFQNAQVSSIDVSNNTSLEILNLNNNNLTEIDVSNNLQLGSLICNDNNISEIDISNNSIIEYLYCNNNQVNLISPNSNLRVLQCMNNQFSEIDLSGFISLESLSCNNNQLDQLDVSPCQNLAFLGCVGNLLTDLDLTQNQSLSNVNCSNNQIETIAFADNNEISILRAEQNTLSQIDLSESINLNTLDLSENIFTMINLSSSTNLNSLFIDDNLFENIDVSSNQNLELLSCDGNPISSLNLNNNPSLTAISLENNPDLESIFLKSGSIINFIRFDNNPNLSYICVDDEELDYIASRVEEFGYTDVTLGTYCSFSPGGEFYMLEGETKLDVNLNGCDDNEFYYENLKFSIYNGIENDIFISGTLGNFAIPLTENEYSVVPSVEYPDYYSVFPSMISLSFPSDGTSFNQDFCVVPSGLHNDLEIVVLPLDQAVPGFDVVYNIIYSNVGTTTLSGTVDFNYSFDVDYMDYVSSSPSETSNVNSILSWDYADLEPFETREIVATFNLNTPTDANFPLNANDELDFEASISPNIGDETPDNNDFGLKQIVVNSFDPNDIRCLEGENILPERVGEYVHYLIRFENLGTANATNIVVKNTIDATKFDVNSLAALNGSHEYYTRINTENEVEFIFENINLPFDDANNDGYVLYKIKTLESLVLGDTFSNQAEIYFDFNAPIITNTYTTEVSEEQLSTNEFTKLNTRVHPNPVTDFLSIKSDTVIESATMYDINGRVMLSTNVDTNAYKLDLSQLNAGLYFLKVFSNSKSETLKIVKR